MKSIDELLDVFKQGTEHLNKMAEGIDTPWNPNQDDPRKLHKIYVQNLVTSYICKFSDLSDAILYAIEKENYTVYAQAGRALIETTAILRYYVYHKYKPLMDQGTMTYDDMKTLIEIDDKHLRGTRFDWESFLFGNYSKLKEDAITQQKNKGNKKSKIHDDIINPQVNVLTCIEKWSKQVPEILIAYNLFCDLVHPNIGSTFLVASVSDKGLYFSRYKGKPVGKSIFEQSFPILLTTTHKPFGELLFQLMATVWQDDEL